MRREDVHQMRGAREQEAFIEVITQRLRFDVRKVFTTKEPLGMGSAKVIKACAFI